MIQDLQFALRTLRKNPGFTLAAIVTLGIGIGANSAMFSAVDGILLRPLPFPQSDRLVNVWETELKRNIPRLVVAPANYYDWRKQNQAFAALGAFQQATFNLASSEGEPERFLGAICDTGFFQTLAVSPMLGRIFTGEEDQPGRDGVLILGYGVWQQRFGADRNVIGRHVEVNGRMRSIIGVMPQGFDYPAKALMWAPLGFDDAARARRDLHRLRVIARLKDGMSLEHARAAWQTIGARLAQQFPDLNKDESIAVDSMLEDAVGSIRPALLVLLGAVGFVLFIACANVANLLLSKASARRREIAIRASLGASRGRLVRQMLTESALLALAGGAAGLLLAAGAFNALAGMAAANVPRFEEIGLSWKIVGVTFGLSLVTGILFGIAPAWRLARTDVNSVLKEGGRGSGARTRTGSALVIAQVAAAVILLSGAGLLIRSFYRVLQVDGGFNPEHVMTMRLAPATLKYGGHPERQIELARGILRNVSALPGVQSAAIATDVPLLGNPIYIMRFEGRPPVTPSEAPVVDYFAVTSGFFDTMGMRIVRGRAISDRDTAGTPLVAVINQTLADRYFPGQDPIGKRLEIGFSTPPHWREIVGIAADVKNYGLDKATPVQVYTAYLQQPSVISSIVPPISVLARTSRDPALLAAAMKSAVLTIDRAQPVYAVQPMTEIVSQSLAERRLSLILLTFFAVSALLLAAVGLYAVIAYNVAQRTNEIGIRMALGAPRSQVVLEVQRRGLLLVTAGLVIGLAGGVSVTRLMKSLLFSVTPQDPSTFGVVAAILLAVAVAACYVPARRAAHVDPIIALRHE